MLRKTHLVLPLLFAAPLVGACQDEGTTPSSSTILADAGGADTAVPSTPDAGDAGGNACKLQCFGGACPNGQCEPAVFVASAGENVYRVRTSATRVVWASGFGSGRVSARPFDGGTTTKVVDTLQASFTFDVEGETLSIVHAPSGIYQYDVTSGTPIGSGIKLSPGGIAPVGVLDGAIYFRGNREGPFVPDGPNYYPLVSSPLAAFGTATTHAAGISGDDIASILPTKTTLFFSGKGGVFQVGDDLKATNLVATPDAASLATDGERLYWIADSRLDGKRQLMRSKLDGSESAPLGPEKVLSLAAIPGRIFYAVETSRYQGRADTSIMVLGTKP